MRYDLCTPERKEKIGEVILDESPQKGDLIRFNNGDWRLKEIVWQQNANDKTNSISSGLLCIEPI